MTMAHTRSRHPHRKARKSYTLSPESVEFLEATRKKQKARSVSSILEEILQAVRRAQAKAELERAVGDYYNSLSPGEAEELSKWGEFASLQFPGEDA